MLEITPLESSSRHIYYVATNNLSEPDADVPK